MQNIAKDLKHAARRLLRSPAFSIAAVLTLGLGLAANTSIFTLVNRVILRPLPYPESDRLLWVDHVAPGIDLAGTPGLSQGLYDHYRTRIKSFSDLAIFRRDDWTLTGNGEPARIPGIVATASLRDALRTAPAYGRWFTEQEAQDNAAVVVLGHGIWTSRFGSDAGIVGQTVQLDGRAREVIGVMPADFSFPNPAVQLYFPERLDERQRQRVGGFNYQSIARLRDGATVAAVKHEMDVLIAGLKTAFPTDPVAQQALDAARLAGMPRLLKDQVIGPVQRTLWILLAMVGIVLLIACVNVANLFLVRSETRQREVAVRRALGAGQIGIIRYFMAESVLLTVAGGMVGVALSFMAVRLLVRFGPENLPRLNEVAVDAGTIAWATMLVLLTSIVFGVIPLLQRRGALASTLRDGGRNATVGRARFRARNALMAGQVALALVLLVGSGLMVKSFLRLRAVQPGFVAENVLTFDVALAGSDFPDRAAALGFIERLLERLRATPGVQSASAVTCLPLAGGCWGDPLQVRGRPPRQGELPPLVQFRRALPGYFSTMQIPIVQGRAIEAADHQQKTGALVISRRAAELYFPDEDPLGKQLGQMFEDENGMNWYTVVGVAGDVPVENLGERPYPVVYLAATDPVSETGSGVHNMAFVVRANVASATLMRAVVAAAEQVNPNVALGHLRPMSAIVSDATARTAFTMMLLLIAGGIALVLGAIGIYGVISYVVGQRTTEIGVRMALGAAPGTVSAMVLRQSGAVVVSGVLIGLIAALALSRLMTSILFQVKPTDAVTYVTVVVFLLAIGGLASWLPARRAASLDPLKALNN